MVVYWKDLPNLNCDAEVGQDIKNKVYIGLTQRRFEFGSFTTFSNFMQCNLAETSVSSGCSSIVCVFFHDNI